MTTRSSPSYLFQTPYSYYFRIRIPDDLQLHFAGKTEIKRSLQTGYLSDAKYKARLIAGQVQRLFRYLHGKEPNAMTAKKYSKFTDDILNDIVSKYVQGHIEGFEEHMLEDRKRPLTMEELENIEWGYWHIGSEAKEALATGDYEFISNDADKILKGQGIKKLDSHDYKKLCRELLKAQVDVLGRLAVELLRILRSVCMGRYLNLKFCSIR